nr:lactococcin 972 family bacteriocin [Kibdelosporangium sp. MJ126-NF4]CEL18081.1 hypothetical protein [Kibdelosporangium sp. MJ126-NF4]CTQ90690.1 hypothetical protein [Kibdelosporangium sp. MJ126-NF4]
MAIGSKFLQVAKVASVASFVLLSPGIASAAQASEAAPAPEPRCQKAEGGDWCQGWELSGLQKRCYSNYIHPNNYHSSTAVLGSAVDKKFASAGNWSQASTVSGAGLTCYTYYNANA